jgi:hypothetical protein
MAPWTDTRLWQRLTSSSSPERSSIEGLLHASATQRCGREGGPRHGQVEPDRVGDLCTSGPGEANDLDGAWKAPHGDWSGADRVLPFLVGLGETLHRDRI